MSVVTWDGRILAADRQACIGDTVITCPKLFKLSNGEVVAFIGDNDIGLSLKEWYENGHELGQWPESRKDDKWSNLIVASKEGCFFYESLPIKAKIYDPFMAWGTGADVALGSMAMGANAVKAVEIASQHSASCGKGCDWVDVLKDDRIRSSEELWREREKTIGDHIPFIEIRSFK
jgi:hypothetical protein